MAGKGALSLLCVYGEDSSDEDVPGYRTSTKRLYMDDERAPEAKRQEKLPVPSCMCEPHSTEEVIDDPTLHDGRLRSFAHERGNWATYAFIPYDSNEFLERLLLSLKVSVASSVDLKCLEEFHMSLTRTVILRYHWITPFVDTLKETLPQHHKFVVMLDRLTVYCNEEKTRTFIALEIKTGHDSLQKIVNTLDKCLDEYNLQKFYENPSFHISIAWCLGDRTAELRHYLPQWNHELEQLLEEFTQEYWYVVVNKIFCRSGNKMFSFNLT